MAATQTNVETLGNNLNNICAGTDCVVTMVCTAGDLTGIPQVKTLALSFTIVNGVVWGVAGQGFSDSEAALKFAKSYFGVTVGMAAGVFVGKIVAGLTVLLAATAAGTVVPVVLGVIASGALCYAINLYAGTAIDYWTDVLSWLHTYAFDHHLDIPELEPMLQRFRVDPELMSHNDQSVRLPKELFSEFQKCMIETSPDWFETMFLQASLLPDRVDRVTSNAFSRFLDAGTAEGPVQRRDPVAIDVNGGGIETTFIKFGGYFDHDGDGFAEQTGWVDSSEGLLVMDRNGDGIINDGTELFGDQTILADGSKATDGFQALTEMDSNKDGKIDSADKAFSQLKVWVDVDGDGYSLPGELHTLEELGITSIDLDSHNDSMTDGAGNIRNSSSSFERADGSTGLIAEYSFLRDGSVTIASEWLPVSQEIGALPDLRDYGHVFTLHQAMTRDTGGQLQSLVEQFVNAVDPDTRNSLMDQILFEWTGADEVDPGSRGPNMDARKLAVLEAMFNRSFVGEAGPNPTYEAAALLNESYRQIFEVMYGGLMKQTHLADYYGNIIYIADEDAGRITVDVSGVIAGLQDQLTDNTDQGRQGLAEFARSIRGLGARDMVDYLSFRETFVQQDPDLGWVIDTGGLPVIDHVGQGMWSFSRHMDGTDNSEAIMGSLTEGDGYINGRYGNEKGSSLLLTQVKGGDIGARACHASRHCISSGLQPSGKRCYRGFPVTTP